MRDITPDICDQFEDQVTLLNLPLQNFGQRTAFHGEIVTVRCYHDNSKVREVLEQDGTGKVLIVDGHGSCQKRCLVISWRYSVSKMVGKASLCTEQCVMWHKCRKWT